MKPPRLWAGVNGSGGFLAPRGGRGFRIARSADGLSKGRGAETDSYKELLKSFRVMGLWRNGSRLLHLYALPEQAIRATRRSSRRGQGAPLPGCLKPSQASVALAAAPGSIRRMLSLTEM